ncbi:WhiB-like transcription regulator [Cutibacterium acnes JCM 18918]|nr:WhiB-like transcription regulator [Cutibacterium acnes JCM 18918]
MLGLGSGSRPGHGVWGGMSEDERRAIKRRQSRSRVRRS